MSDDAGDLYQTFVQKWVSDGAAPPPESDHELKRVEKEFDLRLPLDYREFIERFGAVDVDMALLDSIDAQELEIRDLAELYSAEDVMARTRELRRGGMRDDLVAIGRDCSGNAFCFRTGDCRGPARRGVPVWFFDQERGAADLEFESFESWIGALAQLEPAEYE